MKNCQDKKEYKKFFIFLFFYFCLNFLFTPIIANAVDFSLPGGTAVTLDEFKGINDINVIDEAVVGKADESILQSIINWTKKFVIDEAVKVWEEKGDIAYKAMLSNFVNTLVYDTATYLATGDEGQSPMFETDDISDYLVNAADNAAGIFLEKLGQGGTLQFNLCEPDFNVLSKINVGLYKHVRPSEPECTFSELIENWDEELSDPDFLPKFQDMFNPWSNDLGIALSLQTGMTKEIEIFKDNALYRYPIYPEFKPVTEPISGKNKSPAATSKKAHDLAFETSPETERTYTGTLTADAISIFVNTLIGTLIEEWLREGLVTEFTEYESWDYGDDDDLADYESDASSGGIAAAEDRFKELIEPSFNVRGDYDILSELTMCPDPIKAGPTNCVITDNFSQAVINRMTVGDAMDQGYLDANGIFGFNSDGLEPDYYDEGYPYRSMIILRKFRIIPVGWEVAAQYINDNASDYSSVSTADTFTISQDGTTWTLSNTFSSALEPAGFYDYHDSTWPIEDEWHQSNSEELKAYMQGDRSIIFVYYNELTNEHSIGFLHDCSSLFDPSCTDSALETTDPALEDDLNLVEFTFDSITLGNEIVVADDSPLPRSIGAGETINDCVGTETECFESSKDVSGSLGGGDHWWWKFNRFRTDGGMIQMPADDWSITITPNFINGFNQWAVIDGNGDAISLDMNQPVTISKTIDSSAESVAGTGGVKNLGDLVACYDSSDDYNGYYASWCDGLVDPYWVLKAPLNYCKREGYGPEIISEQVMGDGYDSELAISRNDDYCADEQSCIKENDDGSCQLYGYCTEERRKWLFNGESCEPRYNTCETFRDSEGGTVSYLENTLDYSVCDIDNVGCQAYCEDFDYSTDDWSCTQSTGDKLYFDNDVEECGEEEEGCHEFIRTKAGLGANLLVNSSFEDDLSGTIWENDGAIDDGYDGYNGLQLSSNLSKTIEIGPSDYSISGEAYSLSFYAKDCSSSDTFEISGQTASADLDSGSDWQYYQTARVFSESNSGNTVSFEINSNTCVIDAIKLERSIGLTATDYTDYRGAGMVYEKIVPEYLEDECYVNSGSDYQYNDSAPDECYDFARKCNKEEAGCELYSSVSDNTEVPAKVTALDYCPSECNGYDTYIQAETVFDSARDSYFIPASAQACGAESAGCDEFTNLDEVELGGEGVEYYTYLRQCVKPSDPLASCSEFYAWEGSDESGYQLKVFNLQTDGEGINAEPELTEDDSLECDSDIYSLSSSDPAYNSDCREFYNSSGGISYHLYTRTISCSSNCHPYRRTALNIDPLISDESSCSGDEMHWDSASEECIVCKSKGTWSDQHSACLYDAIPEEGVECSVGNDSCREYSGNTGNNMMVLITDDFEDGTSEDWGAEGGTSVTNSNESIMAGGHSLLVSGGTFSASKEVGTFVDNNKSYVLSFNAKSSGLANLNASFKNSAGDTTDFGEVELSYNWQSYTLNTVGIEHEIDSSEILLLAAGDDFYIDNIELTEIVDRYYLIKDSWDTPDSCNQDVNGNPHPLYMLGCGEYYDRDNITHYLKSFSYLCYEDAVGCEILIDTHNYSDYNGAAWNSGDGAETVVAGDNFIYAVYDSEKECNSSDQGCQLFGSPYEYESEVIYENIYLLNNPDDYDSILCVEEADGCEEWATSDGSSYFKDPGDQVCEWGQAYSEATDSWKWLKKQVKRCDDNASGDIDKSSETSVCLSDSDCGIDVSCISDDNDYDCPTTEGKTLGIGGSRIQIPAAAADDYRWVGLCPSSEAGCSEYIDPISRFSPNLVFNPDFSQNVDGNAVADGWSAAGAQDVQIDSYYLFRFAGKNNDAGSVATITCPYGMYRLDENNNFNEISGGDSYSISLTNANQVYSILFYQGYDQTCEVTMDNIDIRGNDHIELKEMVIDYQLKQDLDKTSCNGIVDFEEGCVLFNERYRDGASLVSMDYDADLTIEDGTGGSPETGDVAERDANSLIKVVPDRVCGQWLACRSYIKDEDDNNVCFDIGLCDSVDDNGNCSNFIITDKVNQAYNANIHDIGNISGYAKVGYSNNSWEADYYHLGAMEQEGQITDVSNGGFEYYGSNGYPIGWSALDADNVAAVWDENKFKVINNPIEAEESEGIGYPADGKSVLKYSPSSGDIISEFIDVEPDTEYVLSALMNTMNFYPSVGFDTVAVVINFYTYDADGNQSSHPDFPGSLDVIECGNQVQPWYNGCSITLNSGYDWTELFQKFKVGANTSKIKLIIRGWVWYGGLFCCDLDGDDSCPEEDIGEFWTYPSQSCVFRGETSFDYTDYCDNVDEVFYATIESDSCAGNAYIDDVKLRPALNNKDDNNILQTCRLYPEDDSLSCDYYDDSGARQKGWLGYCLEYDRYPGSSDACLMWWPIDKVRGEGIEEGAGYADRFPLYYCTDKTDITGTFFRADTVSGSCYAGNGPNDGWCGELETAGSNENMCCIIDERTETMSTPAFNGEGDDYTIATGCVGPDEDDCHDRATVSFSSDGSTWYEWSTELTSFSTFNIDFSDFGLNFVKYVKFTNITSTDYDYPYFALHDHYAIYLPPSCSEVVQVVNSVGQNKYWSGRVYQGSDYTFDCNVGIVEATCDYLSDYSPFGSIVPGAETWNEAANPYEWDSKDSEGNQPLYYELPDESLSEPYQARMGQAQTEDSVKQLFAQSYGVWEWDGANYAPVSGQGWGPPDIICDGESRGESTVSYCAVPPYIANIEANGNTENITIAKNGFINLTFNSTLDSQQLPLVMYAIDWGDDEDTVVSGVEMRDRSNIDNPHSLYHLYNYWDLKAKNAGGASGIECNSDCSGYGVSGACCAVKPSVKIKDNWGWCNNGVDYYSCSAGGYEDFSGLIIVTEN